MAEFPLPPPPQVPPAPDAPKKQAARRPWYHYAGLAIVIILGLAIVRDILSTLGTTDDEPCVDRTEVEAAHNRATQAMADASEAINAGNLASTVPHLRDAADAYRATADAVSADPEVAGLVTQVSVLLDSAADAAEQGRLAVVQERMRAEIAALRQAQTAIDSSTVQQC